MNSSEIPERCAWPRCRVRRGQASGVTWLGRWLCDPHYDRSAAMPLEEAKVFLGLPAATAARVNGEEKK